MLSAPALFLFLKLLTILITSEQSVGVKNNEFWLELWEMNERVYQMWVFSQLALALFEQKKN